MGLKEAVIYLDNQINTYYPGQAVNGRIEYVFDSPKKVRGIHVRFKGDAHTEWHEDKEERDLDGKSQSATTYHTGNEEYFNINYYLLGNATGNEIEIPAGKQVYDFTFTLPPVLPSSFEGRYGYIRYVIKVTLDRPWKFDQETKLAFTVVNPLDLNLNPSYREPIHIQLEKTFCCFCCTSLPLSVDVQTPVSGYCPGQHIPITIDIDNKSNVQLHLVKIFLKKVSTYRATSGQINKDKDDVATIQEGPAPAGTMKHWEVMLEVPPVPPSNLVSCSIIDLDYEFAVECVVSGMHLNMKDWKYITIGTVPLLGLPGQVSPSAPPQPPAPSQPAVLPVGPGETVSGAGDGAGGGWVVPGAAPPPDPPFQSLYPTLTEPVYKESPYTARTIHDRTDSSFTGVPPMKFAPYYPTYAGVQPPPLPQ